MGTQYRFGPRAIREASTLFSFGHGGAYDHEDDTVYVPVDQVRIVDVGDADIVHTDTATSHAHAERAVRKLLERGALPVVLGGDHAVNTPCIRAIREHGPIHIVKSTPISTSSTCATACARATATRCAGRRSRSTSRG